MSQLRILICAFACLKDPDVRFGFGKGGESGLGWNMILQISKLGEVSVLTDYGNKEEIEKKISEEKIFGIQFYYIGLPKIIFFSKKVIQVYAYLWQIKAYFIAKKLHKINHFNVFHHITYANDWMASYIGVLLPIPYIRGPGGGAHYVPKKFVKEYPIKDRLSQRIRGVGQWIFRHDPFFIMGQDRAKAILVCNKEAFNAMPQKWQKKSYFFPVNGISSKDLKLEYKGTNSGKFKIISAGKLIRIKGFDLVIKSFRIFSGKIKDAELVIVGDGPELKNLEKLASGLDFNNEIVFEKWMTREKLLEKMVNCDVFIFCSLRDGGGQVIVDAMAMGKPVVCFDIAGPGFHIDENCGIKIKAENPEQAIRDMAKALEKLYSDQELRIGLGKEARRKAELEYDWDKLGERLQKIYQKI